MEGERFIQFADSMPMKPGMGEAKKLDSRNADRWIFKNKFTFKTVVVILFLIFMLPPLTLLTQKALVGVVALLIALFFLVILLIRKFSNTPVFDFENQCFYRSRKKPRYGDHSTLKDYLPFSQIAGIQFLYKVVHGSKGHTHQGFEINLFTQELTRVFVVDGENKEQLYKEAQMLAERLNVPLKENDENKVVQKRMPVWVRCVFGILFGGAGTGLLGSTVIFPLAEQLNSQKWVPVAAVVSASDISSHTRKRSKGASYTVYKANIKYKYQYKKRIYTADRHNFFSNEYERRSEARDVLKHYPAGKKTTCFVDPENPSRAVLTRRIEIWELVKNALFSGFFLCGGLFFIFTRRL